MLNISPSCVICSITPDYDIATYDFETEYNEFTHKILYSQLECNLCYDDNCFCQVNSNHSPGNCFNYNDGYKMYMNLNNYIKIHNLIYLLYNDKTINDNDLENYNKLLSKYDILKNKKIKTKEYYKIKKQIEFHEDINIDNILYYTYCKKIKYNNSNYYSKFYFAKLDSNNELTEEIFNIDRNNFLSSLSFNDYTEFIDEDGNFVLDLKKYLIYHCSKCCKKNYKNNIKTDILKNINQINDICNNEFDNKELYNDKELDNEVKNNLNILLKNLKKKIDLI